MHFAYVSQGMHSLETLHDERLRSISSAAWHEFKWPNCMDAGGCSGASYTAGLLVHIRQWTGQSTCLAQHDVQVNTILSSSSRLPLDYERPSPNTERVTGLHISQAALCGAVCSQAFGPRARVMRRPAFEAVVRPASFWLVCMCLLFILGIFTTQGLSESVARCTC